MENELNKKKQPKGLDPNDQEDRVVATECYQLIEASTKRAVKQEVNPVVDDLRKATKSLLDITPLLRSITNRQDRHLIWLIGLTASTLIIGFMLYAHIN